MPKPKVRTGSPSVQLAKEEFFRRARERFYDPTFAAVTPQIESVLEAAWRNYAEYHKSPRTRKAGARFSDPEFPLAVEWLETRKAIAQAAKRQKSPGSKSPKKSFSAPKDLMSICSISADLLRNTDESSIRAKPASPRPCRYAIGRAPVIRTTPWGR